MARQKPPEKSGPVGEKCPNGHDLLGRPIKQEDREAGLYGPVETAPTHYSRKIGHEVQGVYDGILYWACPDCGVKWQRWPKGTRLYNIAKRYGAIDVE